MSATAPAPGSIAGTPADLLHDPATRRLLHAMAVSGRQILAAVVEQPLLALAVLSIVLVILGGMLRRPLPMLGGLVRFFGNLGLICAILGAIVEVAQLGGGLGRGMNFTLPGQDAPTTVSGRETRVALGPDGHFWLRVAVNGVSRRFLVDTGATLTTVSPGTAQAAGLHATPDSGPVLLNTANGTATGKLATIDTLRVGNIVARRIDAVVAPGLGKSADQSDINVLGMNFLSALASWRVEGDTMILVPHHPQAQAQDDAAAGDEDSGPDSS